MGGRYSKLDLIGGRTWQSMSASPGCIPCSVPPECVPSMDAMEYVTVSSPRDPLDESNKTDPKLLSPKSRRHLRRKKRHTVQEVMNAMEYDHEDMHPDISLLVMPKRDMNFQDIDLIRAMYVESETNLLSRWKEENARRKPSGKPKIEIRYTKSDKLKKLYREFKLEKEKYERNKPKYIEKANLNPPKFASVLMPTTITAMYRFARSRNDPEVPKYFIQHYERYRKPPFKLLTKIRHTR